MSAFWTDIVTCGDCGQKNRVPDTVAVGKALICGSCKAPLDLDDPDGDEPDLDDDSDDE